MSGLSENGEIIRMDVHGNEARVFVDERRTQPAGDRSALLGAGWAALRPFGGDVDDVGVSPTDSNLVLAGIAPSGSSGGTGSFSVNEISVDRAASTPIYVGSSSIAVWKSDDGITFHGSSVGIGSLNLEHLAFNPNDHDEIAVPFQGLNDGGIYSSTDGGATFSVFDGGLSGAGAGKEIILAPDDCNTLFLATSNGAYVEYEGGCLLEGDVTTLSVSAGGTLNLSLARGPDNAGRFYIALGSTTGTDGISVGSIVIPLTFDAYTSDTIAQANQGLYVNTFGALNGSGMAAASITLPPGSDPALIGLDVWFAHAVFTLGPLTTYRASNAIHVDIDS